MANILVGGIVAYRDKRPYVQIDVDGHIVQLSVADARNVAADIVQQAARSEADAMIWRFFAQNDLPEAGAVAMMTLFRDFRSELDREHVEKFEGGPQEPEG